MEIKGPAHGYTSMSQVGELGVEGDPDSAPHRAVIRGLAVALMQCSLESRQPSWFAPSHPGKLHSWPLSLGISRVP